MAALSTRPAGPGRRIACRECGRAYHLFYRTRGGRVRSGWTLLLRHVAERHPEWHEEIASQAAAWEAERGGEDAV